MSMADTRPLYERITPATRTIVTICVMLATLMQALDSTIANVALPYMQGTLSANADQINWVLTSYVVAAAIMTAPVGWLTARFGAKNVLLVSLVGFTATSMLCGIAGGIGEMVMFCQGSSARLAPNLKECPVDAVIIGIVDTVDVFGKEIFNAKTQ